MWKTKNILILSGAGAAFAVAAAIILAVPALAGDTTNPQQDTPVCTVTNTEGQASCQMGNFSTQDGPGASGAVTHSCGVSDPNSGV